MKAVVVALVVLVGCKSQTPPKPMDGKACEASVPPAIDRVMADYAKDPRVVAVIDKAKSEMTSLCVADEWPPAVGKCIDKAKDRAALDQCRAGLSNVQMDHVKGVNARLRGAIEQVVVPAPEAPAPAPETGSGSAGSGSAH